MTAYMQTQNSWEVYANIRQDALAFLDTQELVPDVMYIAEDGWVEAVYTYPNNNRQIMERWQAIADGRSLQLQTPLLEMAEKRGETTLRVSFNLQAAPSASLWQRLKKLVS